MAEAAAEIPWPETPIADFTRRYLSGLFGGGPAAMIRNARTALGVVIVDDVVLPISVGQEGAGNSYVCAPYSHYVLYARQELRELGSAAARGAMRAALWPLDQLSRWGRLDDVVMVNNWLLSTNLYPPITAPQIQAVLSALLARFPARAIVFRSLDEATRAPLLSWLSAAGCRRVASRRVNINARGDERPWRRSNTRYDLKLKARTPLRLIEGEAMSDAQLEQAIDLYNQLYLEKYSYLNPQFTPRWLRHLRDERLWRLQGFMDEADQLRSVCATFALGGVSTAPIIGYDRAAPAAEGLYRLAYLQMLLMGREAETTVNCSAGAARFKRLRGALPALEYSAVYDRHLSARRRLPWAVWRWALDTVAIPAMVRQDL